MNAADFLHCLPLLFITGWACLVLLAHALGQGKSSGLGPLALMGLILGVGVTVWSWIEHAQPATHLFGGMVIVDRFALFLDLIFLLSGILTVLISGSYLKEQRTAFGEFFSLLLLVIAGMMILVHSGDFVLMVIGLETMSLGVYALSASWIGNRKSAEAGFKYFIMGAVASAFLLYGIALVYGTTGQTNFIKLTQMTQLSPEDLTLVGSPLYLLGMFMILGAMAFKVALVPFHAWTPDVYEGAPTVVTGFMATAVKAAGFGVLLRVFAGVFGADALIFGSTGWGNVLWWLAVLTMTLGNLTALRQTNIKRMLAYSSISHAGYILVGVIAAGAARGNGSATVLYYLLAYTVTTIGAFGMIAWLGSWNDERIGVEEWAGLGIRHPAAALAMTLFMLSLAGMPPTAGFFAKFYIFREALAAQGSTEGMLSLVIIAALNSVVSIYYYLKPVVAMYFRQESRKPSPLHSGQVSLALVLAALLVLLLGITPGHYLEWASQSIMVAFGR